MMILAEYLAVTMGPLRVLAWVVLGICLLPVMIDGGPELDDGMRSARGMMVLIAAFVLVLAPTEDEIRSIAGASCETRATTLNQQEVDE